MTPPGGVCFPRAAPFVAWKSAEHEIAHYQPESRIWNPVRPVRPSTLRDPPEKGGSFTLPSRLVLRPVQLDSPIINARELISIHTY